MSSKGYCQKYNNAGQAVGGSVAKPVIYVWNTNDTENPWSAQARLVGIEDNRLMRVLGNGSGTRVQDAKEAAAREGYETLQAIYPDLNL